MKKSIIVCISLCLFLACLGIGIISASTNENVFFLAGQFLNSGRNEGSAGTNSNVTILAKYNGMSITSAVVEYKKKLNILRSNDAVQLRDTDVEIINKIIENMMLFEEAERLGLSATEAEIESMVQNTVQAYSIPEGKEMMDAYFKGAGITMEEYLQMVREQAPTVIACQKLKDMIGKQYCEKHGLQFTKVNPPAEMVAAQEEYINSLFEENKHKIEYFIATDSVS